MLITSAKWQAFFVMDIVCTITNLKLDCNKKQATISKGYVNIQSI